MAATAAFAFLPASVLSQHCCCNVYASSVSTGLDLVKLPIQGSLGLGWHEPKRRFPYRSLTIYCVVTDAHSEGNKLSVTLVDGLQGGDDDDNDDDDLL